MASGVPEMVQELKADPRVPMTERRSADQDAKVVVCCGQAPGFRALSAASTLSSMGYTNVVAMAAGTSGRQEAGLALE